jgi:hypothetical protein
MKRGNFPGRKSQKQNEAKLRQKAYDQLSNEQKLTALDERLGRGKGAVKQRYKLLFDLAKKMPSNVLVSAKPPKSEKGKFKDLKEYE